MASCLFEWLYAEICTWKLNVVTFEGAAVGQFYQDTKKCVHAKADFHLRIRNLLYHFHLFAHDLD